jgi:hypothetical protein
MAAMLAQLTLAVSRICRHSRPLPSSTVAECAPTESALNTRAKIAANTFFMFFSLRERQTGK